MTDDTRIIIDDPQAPEPLPLPAPPTDPAELQRQYEEAQKPELAPFALAVIDIDWPDERSPGFTVELPQPAVFQRLVRAEVASPILGGRRKSVMRSIWLVKADGAAAKCTFVCQQVDQVMAIPADGTGPRLLGTVVDQFGNPIAVWQRTQWEAVPLKDAPVLHTV